MNNIRSLEMIWIEIHMKEKMREYFNIDFNITIKGELRENCVPIGTLLVSNLDFVVFHDDACTGYQILYAI
jgi:hypothetical protein